MPFPVKNLIEGHPSSITVMREDLVTKALSQMLTFDYSQLPVIDTDGRPIGMITYERILRGVRNLRASLEDLKVLDVMLKKPPVFNLEDDLFELLEQLKLTNAVLIIDAGGMLAGIVTSYDSTEYFRKRAENLMRVEDIEVTLKDFILLHYTFPDGSREEEKLAQAIEQVIPKDEPSGKKAKSFDELTLGQYISLLTTKNSWPFYEKYFTISRTALIEMLDGVRATRNDLAHFRRDITPEQVDQLNYCSGWLADRWEDYQAQKEQELLISLFGQSKPVERPPVMVGQEKTDIQLHVDNAMSQPVVDGGIEIFAEESRPHESRYAPLIDYLQSQPGRIDVVKLSFEEVETIIAGELPASARNHRAWWANDAVGHPHSQLWLEAGWRTTYINLTDQHVTFTRIREREKAYIDFFSKLLNDLQKRTEFPLRSISPDGSNWVVCQTLTPTGPAIGEINYSFARGRQFRVELYIDTGEQKSTKEIFDRINAHRVEIETVLGQVNWERIDDKRASRVAIYHPGAITDNKEQLGTLREWAVSMMIAFYKTIEPVASQAIVEVLKP